MPNFYVTPVSVNNSASLNSIAASSYARLDLANIFTSSITISGSLSVSGKITASSFAGDGASITGLSKLYNGSTLIAEINAGNEFILHRVNSASEGGQITFNKGLDDTMGWYIDLYGATASPTMRWVDSISTVRMTLEPSGNLSTTGNVIYNQATNSSSITAYSLVSSDSGKFVEMTSSAANTITVPAASAVAWAIGTRIDIIQYGAGQTTIAPAVGVTINYYSPSSAATRTIKARYGAATLIYRASNEWLLIGNLT